MPFVAAGRSKTKEESVHEMRELGLGPISSLAMQGDLDDDGAVGISDAILALQILVGQTDLDLSEKDDVDVDGDGVFGLAEAIFALRRAAQTGGDTVTDSSGLGMTFVRIPAGTFMMGSPADEPGRYSDETQHQVTLTRDYYMMTTEVTQAQWEAVMGRTRRISPPAAGIARWRGVLERYPGFHRGPERHGRPDLPVAYRSGMGIRGAGRDDDGVLQWRITHTTTPLDPNLDAIGRYGGNSGRLHTEAATTVPGGAENSRTPSDFMICPAMSGNGCRIGMEVILTAP
jgi:hypothetical protein